MAKKFNLAEFLADTGNVSDLDTLQIVRIPWDRIKANELNFYAVDDVEDLRNSIQIQGLLDPVTVTPDAEEGWYLLISGHRRHKAWGLLRQEDPEKYAEIPAIVRRFELPAMTELAMIMANSATRVLSSAEIGRQAERVERLFYELKEAGYEFPGRMRDQVAKACNVSASKIARLKLIREKLSPSWTPKWESGKLPEDTAYRLAGASEEIQERIFKNDPKATAYAVERVRAIMEAGNDYSCTGLTGPGCLKCTHGDAFLRHDLSDPWSPCEGKTCCLKCDKAKRDWNPCQRMCSKAKERRQAASAKEKEAQAKKDAENKNRILSEIRESALRLLKAADAAGVDDKTEIKLSGYGAKTVKWLRTAAAGGDIGYTYRNDIASECLDVAKVARALHCSADYVCGLTDDLQPAPGPCSDWQTGDPAADGRYLCLVDMGDGGYHEQRCEWADGFWTCYGRTLDGLFRVAAWYPLPPEWHHWMGVPGAEPVTEEDDEQ